MSSIQSAKRPVVRTDYFAVADLSAGEIIQSRDLGLPPVGDGWVVQRVRLAHHADGSPFYMVRVRAAKRQGNGWWIPLDGRNDLRAITLRFSTDARVRCVVKAR